MKSNIQEILHSLCERIGMFAKFVNCSMLMLVLLFGTAESLFSQARASIIDGVAEPPELTGPSREIKQPTQADLKLFKIISKLGNFENNEKVTSGMSDLANFVEENPSYSDAYFLRAFCQACVLDKPNSPSVVADIKNAMSHPGAQVYNSTDYYSLLAKIELEN